jgi:hypothetical protein
MERKMTSPEFPRTGENAGQQFPATNEPQHQPGAAARGRRRRPGHRARNVALLAVGLLVVVAVISAVADNGGKDRGDAGTPPAVGSAPAPAATTPALGASAQQFVSDLQSSSLFSVGSSTSAAQIASYGQQVCSMRQGGQKQAAAISFTETAWSNMSPMLADALTRLAEQDMCAGDLPEQSVTYIVRGTAGAQVTYGPAGSDFNGSVPMMVTERLGDPEYYAINAQLQGGGSVSCSIEVDGIPLSTASASGGYNIADCEIGQDPVTNLWENDNTG